MAMANRQVLLLRLFFATMLALAVACQSATGAAPHPAPPADEWKIRLCSGVRAEPGVSIGQYYWVAIPNDRGRCDGDGLLYVEVKDVSPAELAELVALAEDVVARGPRSTEAWSKISPELVEAYERGIEKLRPLNLCAAWISGRYERTRTASLSFCTDAQHAIPENEDSWVESEIGMIVEISNDPRPALLYLQVSVDHADSFL